MVDGYDLQTGEYYLERNSRLTDHIMDYFATGHETLSFENSKFR